MSNFEFITVKEHGESTVPAADAMRPEDTLPEKPDTAAVQARISLERQLDLVGKYKKGDRDSGEELVNAYRPYLERKAKVLLAAAGKEDDKNLFEDMLQEGILGVLIASERHSGNESLTTRVNGLCTRMMQNQLDELTSPLAVSERIFESHNNNKDVSTDGTSYLIGDRQDQEDVPAADSTLRDINYLRRILVSQSSEDISEVESETPDLQDIEVDGFSITEKNDLETDTVSKVRIQEMLSILNEREQIIIEMTFGIGEDNTVYALNDMAKIFSLSSTRIQQIQKWALLQLRQARFADPRKDLD